MSRVDQLKDSQLNGCLADGQNVYYSHIDRLVELYDTEREYDFSTYMKRWRQTVAAMLDLFEGMG